MDLPIIYVVRCKQKVWRADFGNVYIEPSAQQNLSESRIEVICDWAAPTATRR